MIPERITAVDIFDPEIEAWIHGGQAYDEACREFYDGERETDPREHL